MVHGFLCFVLIFIFYNAYIFLYTFNWAFAICYILLVTHVLNGDMCRPIAQAQFLLRGNILSSFKSNCTGMPLISPHCITLLKTILYPQTIGKLLPFLYGKPRLCTFGNQLKQFKRKWTSEEPVVIWKIFIAMYGENFFFHEPFPWILALPTPFSSWWCY